MFEHPRNFREKIRHTKTNYTSFTFYAFYKLGNAPNRFRPGLRSGPHWGSLQRSLRPLAGGEGARRVLPKNPTPPRPFGLRSYRLCCVVPQHPPKIILVTALTRPTQAPPPPPAATAAASGLGRADATSGKLTRFALVVMRTVCRLLR